MSRGNGSIVESVFKVITVLGFLHEECMTHLLEGVLFVSVWIL
jgi:hypothetical protein